MAELDQIQLNNPMNEDFKVFYNGEEYTLRANEVISFPQHLARHVAKHLSDKLVYKDIIVEKEERLKKKEPMKEVEETQKGMYDNPQRRIALYKILKNKSEVERVVKSYPQFKAMDGKFNFIGEIEVYDKFVEDFEEEKTSKLGNKTPEVKKTT